MVPYNIWGARCLNEVVQCPGCGEPAIVGDSIAYRLRFFVKGGVTYGAYYIFHSFDCLLMAVEADHIGHT
jgi:hypothetical protein